MIGVDGPKLGELPLERWRGNYLAEVLRVARFGVVGISALATYWLVTNLVAWTGLALLPASIAGYFASAFVSYFGHSHFSFRVSADHRTYGAKFLVVALLGLVIDVVSVQACSAAHVPAGLTTAIIGVSIPAFNYLFNRLWVFSSGLDSLDH